MIRALALLPVLLLALPVPGAAQTERFAFAISGTQMVPATDSPAAGSADLLLDLPRAGFSGFIDFGALRGALTNVRIRGPAGPGEVAPVLFDLGRTRHVLLSGLDHGQIRDLQQELWYLEVCTDVFPEGEERGQIVHGDTPVGTGTWGRIKALYR